ncbi:MAG: sigma-E factor negative regulatory protein [Gammaproteobacteria bacterium]|jgi:negative regulator of sigma E activity|nr:sigma-E factor negative regulatory protein [Gammaproteobacteria bacterium]
MEKDVTRGIEEQLSAFLDGELPEEEVALLVRRLERDDTYLMTLTSYAAIGGVLRNEPRDLGSDRFRAGVLQGIDHVGDAGAADATAQPAARRRAPLAVLATAAALGCVALVAGIWRPGFAPAPPSAVATVDSAAAVATGAAVTPTVAEATSPSADVAQRRTILKRDRMTSYLISHGQQSGSLPGAFGDSRMYVQQASFTE